MSEMIERVARGIATADERNGAVPYEARIAMGKHAREQLFDQARAAIEAMREPTREMIEAPYRLHASADDFIHKSFDQAMMDEALK